MIRHQALNIQTSTDYTARKEYIGWIVGFDVD